MSITLSAAAQNAAANAVVTLIDAGAAGGTIKVYTGSKPATPDTAPSGTLLATLTFSATAFSAASSGTATAAAITGDSSADATGTAGWFRVADSNGAAVFDGTVTATGGGGDMTFDSVSFVAGGTVDCTSLTYTQPTG